MKKYEVGDIVLYQNKTGANEYKDRDLLEIMQIEYLLEYPFLYVVNENGMKKWIQAFYVENNLLQRSKMYEKI